VWCDGVIEEGTGGPRGAPWPSGIFTSPPGGAPQRIVANLQQASFQILESTYD